MLKLNRRFSLVNRFDAQTATSAFEGSGTFPLLHQRGTNISAASSERNEDTTMGATGRPWLSGSMESGYRGCGSTHQQMGIDPATECNGLLLCYINTAWGYSHELAVP